MATIIYTCDGCGKEFESGAKRPKGRYCASCAGILRKAGLGPRQAPNRTKEQIGRALEAAWGRADAKRLNPRSDAGSVAENVNHPDLLTVHQACFEAIGGEDSDAVQTYRRQKDSLLTRDEFFDRATWAILVAGIKRTVADKVKQRAEDCSFPKEWAQLAPWDDERFARFTGCMGSGKRGIQKWSAIRYIARWFAELGSDEAFQQAAFGGKTVGTELGEEDVARLLHLRLPFVGPANAQYIVRMLGGEIIKDDRWVKAFRDSRGWGLDELNREVDNVGTPRGFWDTVLWQYCETYVVETKNLPSHFSREFAA